MLRCTEFWESASVGFHGPSHERNRSELLGSAWASDLEPRLTRQPLFFYQEKSPTTSNER